MGLTVNAPLRLEPTLECAVAAPLEEDRGLPPKLDATPTDETCIGAGAGVAGVMGETMLATLVALADAEFIETLPLPLRGTGGGPETLCSLLPEGALE